VDCTQSLHQFLQNSDKTHICPIQKSCSASEIKIPLKHMRCSWANNKYISHNRWQEPLCKSKNVVGLSRLPTHENETLVPNFLNTRVKILNICVLLFWPICRKILFEICQKHWVLITYIWFNSTVCFQLGHLHCVYNNKWGVKVVTKHSCDYLYPSLINCL
jgi:hypothetical protein